jgi:leucyl-tRNA synthetase
MVFFFDFDMDSVGPTESMSKSKKNTIDPENIIKNYGADSVRLFILSDSPPEKDIQWSDQGMIASFKFVQKLWILNSKILEKIKNNDQTNEAENLTKFTNQLVHKVTQNLERFHYNVIVANFYEMYNFLIKEIEKPIKKVVLIENYKKILILMNPFIPHFSSECLSDINQNQINWPVVSEREIVEESINFVVQINGKKRALLKVKRNINEKEILKEIQLNEETEKLVKDKKIQKTIFVLNRLINIIL